jgi:hypothetical protein
MAYNLQRRINMNYSLRTFILAISLSCIYQFFPPDVDAGKVYLSKGTEIPVKYMMTVSTESKTRPVESGLFEIASDQEISGIGVIRKGDAVYCEILKFKKPGLLGSGGEIEISIDSIHTALGKNISVEKKVLKAKGKSKRSKAIPMILLLGYGILIKGDHAELGKQNETVILKTSKLEQISF